MPQARGIVEEHLSQSLRLDQLIEERLSVLDKHQFERMLRGIFEEDEVILVVIGGVLGGAVGSLQGATVLAAGWLSPTGPGPSRTAVAAHPTARRPDPDPPPPTPAAHRL